MKYGQRSIIDLYVFDEKGTLITVLDSLKESYIDPNNDCPVLYAKDALLDDSLLEFFSRREMDDRTDYDKFISNGFEEDKSIKTLVYRQSTKVCKLIAKTEVRDSESGRDRNMYFEIPKVNVSNYGGFNFKETKPSEWDLAFIIKPFNNDGDLYKIHIEQDAEDDVQKFFMDTKEAIDKVRDL
ncbi:hypothetical protein [Paenibacillus sp. USHLN196]|uniref:hypothetical protein n=1 Tax=Paenibacillus sp. USHLN196 TaxID=3081291 RepID=UPI003017C678